MLLVLAHGIFVMPFNRVYIFILVKNVNKPTIHHKSMNYLDRRVSEKRAKKENLSHSGIAYTDLRHGRLLADANVYSFKTLKEKKSILCHMNNLNAQMNALLEH